MADPTTLESRKFLDPAGNPTEETPADIVNIGGIDSAPFQDVADRGSFVPSSVIPEAPIISEGTDSLTDKAADITAGADALGDFTPILVTKTDALGNPSSRTAFSQADLDNFLSQGYSAEDTTGRTTSDLGSLQSLADQIKTNSQAELDEINKAGEGAGSPFNALIADARERGRQGLASSTVAAGRRGGFFRTRFAGQSALGGTVGDVGFRGAGGKLELIESAFQRNVDALIDAKQQAINAAKSAARQAIETGKQQDFENAKSILDMARQFDKDAQAAENESFNQILKVQQEQRAQQTATFNIIKDIPIGETVNIEGEDFIGIQPSDTDKAFFSGSNIISLMKELEEGETLELPPDPVTGAVWSVVGIGDPDTYQATNDQGTVSVVRKSNGEILSQAENVGKTKTKASSVTLIQAGQEKGAKQEIVDNLNSARDPGTNLVSPAAYVSQFTTFLLNNLGDIGDFRASFPASIYLSPEDAASVNEELATAEAGLSTLQSDDEDEPIF